jgi:L-fuculose-phosphate aldolase
MVKTEREYRDDIVQIGRLVFQKGWVAANDGNISIRLDAERVLATPTGTCKGMMSPDDLIVVDYRGNKISGQKKCTTEIAMHMKVYEMRPEIRAVVHAHPPVATGYATAGRSLSDALLPEVIIGLGCVPLAAYGLPGTPALTEPMIPLARMSSRPTSAWRPWSISRALRWWRNCWAAPRFCRGMKWTSCWMRARGTE